MPSSPKKAWEGIKVLQKGLSAHHKSPQTMRFKQDNGQFSKNDREHIEQLEPHFHRVFNRNPRIEREVFDKVKQYDIMHELDSPINFAEFAIAVKAYAGTRHHG